MLARRKNLKNALQGFLGSFASRYSDYQGYWLLGQLAATDLGGATFDLLVPEAIDSEVGSFARAHAVDLFRSQLDRCGVEATWVRSAGLEIRPTGASVTVRLGDHQAEGQRYCLTATAETDRGVVYRVERRVDIARHDPAREHRSNRADS